MASARYWRLIGLAAYGGGDLELSELQLYGAGGRLDAAATLTCSHAPTAGALADLKDADVATAARFAGAGVKSSGFYLGWDLGGAEEVIGLRVGAAVDKARFLSMCALQYLDGGRWVESGTLGRFPWPGPNTMGDAPSTNSFYQPSATLFLDGSVDFADTSIVARTMTAVGAVALSPAQAIYGTQSMLFSGGYLQSPSSASLAIASGEDFTIAFNSYKSGNGPGGYDGVLSTTTNGSVTDGLALELSSSRGLALLNASAVVFSVALDPNTSQWENWEVSRKSGTLMAFRGGSKIYEIPDSRMYPQAGLTVGSAYPSGPYKFSGFLQQVLFLKGSALHDSNFTPTSLLVGSSTVFDPLPIAQRLSASNVSASAVVGPFAVRNLGCLATARDIEFGGRATLYGTTKTKGTPNSPAKARVVLLHQRSKRLVRETWSDPVTGNWVFTGIDEKQAFLVLAEDAAGNFRPVAANKLIPEVML